MTFRNPLLTHSLALLIGVFLYQSILPFGWKPKLDNSGTQNSFTFAASNNTHRFNFTPGSPLPQGTTIAQIMKELSDLRVPEQVVYAAGLGLLVEEKLRELKAGATRIASSDYHRPSFGVGTNEHALLRSLVSNSLVQEVVDRMKSLTETTGLKGAMHWPADAAVSYLPYLPSQTAQSIDQLRGQMEVACAKLMSSYPPDESQMREAERTRKEWLANMSKVLSPQQFREYSSRYSPFADSLRHEFAYCDISTSQFDSLFRALSDDDPQRWWGNTLNSKSDWFDDASKEVGQFLGEEQVELWKRSRTQSYKELYNFAVQNGLSRDDVDDLYLLREQTFQLSVSIMEGNNQNADEKNQAISELRINFDRDLTEKLGPNRVEKLKSSMIYHWMRGSTGL